MLKADTADVVITKYLPSLFFPYRNFMSLRLIIEIINFCPIVNFDIFRMLEETIALNEKIDDITGNFLSY